MLGTVRYAEQIYYDRKREWNKIIDRAMETDFSWNTSARKYEEMYNWLSRRLLKKIKKSSCTRKRVCYSCFFWREKEVSRRIKKGETADTSSVKEQEVIQDDKFIYP